MAVYDINRILVPDAPPEYEDHTRDVHYVPAPCQVACPIGTDAPSYIAHIWDEDYEGAFEAITSTNPFSSICGRVCDAPCEPACRRVDSDGAVQIRNLKRFVMDKLGATWRPPAAPVTRSRSIGIVGAGPAGLVAAHDLCVAGYAVHVYEMTDRLGGMMIWGDPGLPAPARHHRRGRRPADAALPLAVIPRGSQLALQCVKTALGEPDDDGRRRPVAIDGSEHEILCGSVIAAVGQRSICEELHRADMMAPDRVRTEWDSMRTSDPMVFAAGDGAFGGSTLVMAMQHGQRAAYYLRHFLEGNRDPLPYRTPYRTRRVPVAQDLMWKKFPIQDPVFCGLGERPVEFPEIELTYDSNTARAEAARCYRCDAETGSADYSVQHREDIFSMARTDPRDAPKLKAMLDRRLRLRENPFPEERPACLDDLVFLPANLSRLVIDPYREACKIGWRLGERLDLDIPFFVAGFDAASEELKVAVDRGVVAAGAAYLGATRPGPNAPWLQLCEPGRDAPSHDAAGVVYRVGERGHPMPTARARAEQLLGLLLASRRDLEDAIVYALERDFDLLVLDGTGALGGEWPELRAAPDLALARDTIATLRRLKKEEMIDIAWFGGARSGTDAAKLVGLGVNAIGYGVAVALALGGEITQTDVRFAPDRNEEERAGAVVNILKANAGEASMMARCAGKTRLHNIEPEDLRAVTRATAAATGIPLAGTRAA